MISFKDYSKLDEKLRNHVDMTDFKQTLNANDLEVKFVPRTGGKSVIRIRAKSVNKDTIFVLDVSDINIRNIAQSPNIEF